MARKPKTPPAPAVPVDPADEPLTENEQRFVEEFLIDRNSARAYRRTFPEANYYTAHAAGHRMRRRPNVDREIRAALAAQRVRNQVRADMVLEEISIIAFSDIFGLYDPDTGDLRHPRHIPYDVRKAIASYKVLRTRTTTRTSRARGGNRTRTTVNEAVIEYKFWNKLDALGKLCRHLGLDTEIPPLEALLRALPTELSAAVRAILMGDRTFTTPSLSEHNVTSSPPAPVEAKP